MGFQAACSHGVGRILESDACLKNKNILFYFSAVGRIQESDLRLRWVNTLSTYIESTVFSGSLKYRHTSCGFCHVIVTRE